MSRLTVLCMLLLATAPCSSAANQDRLAPLPPVIPWNGASRQLIVSDQDPWITPCEESGLTRSPSYDETVDWLQRLVAAAPELSMLSIGRSQQGRAIWMVIASAEQAFKPESLRATGKPTLFVQAGIHSGEIDGKDAGMMLLRDMTVREAKKDLLDGANLLFVPILNVDGHERRSATNRMNQRGPQQTGWRTNARNLNLNRDYAKVDTPEMRGLIRALHLWDPELYCDIHVTDGIDYQYDVTTGFTAEHGYSPNTAAWLSDVLRPRYTRDLQSQGHIPGPLVFPIDRRDLTRGIIDWTPSPRYSNGYGDARHLPTLLVENHSLKPFGQRVLGTYVLLESCLRTLARDGAVLRKAIESDRSRRPRRIPLSWRIEGGKPEMIEFLGIASRRSMSEITGIEMVEWHGQPTTLSIPLLKLNQPVESVTLPTAYWVPPTWPEVIDRLRIHGVEMELIDETRTIEVEMYRLNDFKLGDSPFEGHVTVTCSPAVERRNELFPPGSVRVTTDQPLGVLAALLLEPASSDSFFQWGFFLEVLQRTEYFEAYALEPLARLMLEADPKLQEEWERALEEDDELADDPRRRLEWFYDRCSYTDQRWKLYPVGREL